MANVDLLTLAHTVTLWAAVLCPLTWLGVVSVLTLRRLRGGEQEEHDTFWSGAGSV